MGFSRGFVWGSKNVDIITNAKEKALNKCCNQYNLEKNPRWEEMIAYPSYPDRPNKILALLNLLYKQEATSTSLAAVSIQPAGLIYKLRNEGFIFQKDATSKNHLYINTSGQQCRQIIGYKSPEAVYSKESLALLAKAKDAALSALEIYNKPRTNFRVPTYIVLMQIAWTSLFQAAYTQKRKNYCNKNGKTLPLFEYAKEFFQENSPEFINLKFCIEIRNKIEHDGIPEAAQSGPFEIKTSPELQALLLNFEDFIITHFGDKHALQDDLTLPIQLTRAKRSFPKIKEQNQLLQFIEAFKSTLSPEILASQQYAFKAFLLPKIGHHRTSADISIEFIKVDADNMQEYENIMQSVVAITERRISISNIGLMKPGLVLTKLEEKTGIKKTHHWHQTMWKKHQVRPHSQAASPEACNSTYCAYDEAHKDYLYTAAWVDLLVNELENEKNT